MNTSYEKIEIWDLLVRIFHWSLVIFFTVAYITGEENENLHAAVGYVVIGLILFRLVWGMIGTSYARFSSFIYSPTNILNYIKSLLKGNSSRYLGHNPAGGAMILLLILSIIATSASGVVLLGIEGAGPLQGSVFSSLPEEIIEEAHEFFANFTVLLVLFHISGVILSSLVHRENLVSAMINGRKESRQDDISCDDGEAK